MTVEPGSDIARNRGSASHWFRRIILVGLALPFLAELSCDIYLSVQGERLLGGFGVAYFVPGWGVFAFLPLISNAGPFLLYGWLVLPLFRVKFKSQHLARRLVIGGLVGMTIAVFMMEWLLVFDFHNAGQGYLMYIFVFPMSLFGAVGALVGMIVGFLVDRVQCFAARS